MNYISIKLFFFKKLLCGLNTINLQLIPITVENDSFCLFYFLISVSVLLVLIRVKVVTDKDT